MQPIRRGYSALEAWGYERLVAAGVVAAVAPRPLRRGRATRARCRVRRRAPRGVQAPAGALPFRDAAFDSVVSSCSIKHWPDPAAGITECRRVLRPDGALVVVEMDRDAPIAEVRRFVALTRMPRPLRRAYAAFDHRAVLPTACTGDELAALVGAPAQQLDGMPFNVVIARR